MEMRN
jgi:hypothetical protein